MRPYLQHARRHLPTGSDPLPIGVTHYIGGNIILSGSIASGSTTSAVSIDPAGTIGWGTDAGPATPSDFFDLQDPGSGVYSITLLQNGLYILDAQAFFALSGSTPAAGSVAVIASSGNTEIGGASTDLWKDNLSGAHQATPSMRVMINEVSGTPPIPEGINLGQNSGASISAVVVSFFCAYIGAANTQT